MARIAVGIFAFATLTAGLLLHRRQPRSATAADDTEFDIDDLYEAGL